MAGVLGVLLLQDLLPPESHRDARVPEWSLQCLPLSLDSACNLSTKGPQEAGPGGRGGALVLCPLCSLSRHPSSLPLAPPVPSRDPSFLSFSWMAPQMCSENHWHPNQTKRLPANAPRLLGYSQECAASLDDDT